MLYRRVLLIVAGLLAGVAVLEAFLRVAPGLMPETARLYADAQNRRSWRVETLPHPYIGYLYPPGIEHTFAHRDVLFTYKTDGFGFRNDQPWPERADIVALGDSMTFAHGVNHEDAWTTLVRQKLGEIRLVNLGLPGAAPQQYTRIYETYGRELEPRLLIVGLFPGNDLKDAAEFDSWLNSGAGGNFKLWQSFRVSTPGVQYLLAGLVKRSYIFALLLDRIRWARSEVKNETRVFVFNDGSQMILLPRYLENMIEKGGPESPELDLMMKSVERLNKLATENGAACVFLIFPTKEEIYLPLMANRYSADPSAASRGRLDQLGVTYLDLAPEFRKAALDGRRLFFEQDGHPNAMGNALVAELVMDHLRANARNYDLADLASD